MRNENVKLLTKMTLEFADFSPPGIVLFFCQKEISARVEAQDLEGDYFAWVPFSGEGCRTRGITEMPFLRRGGGIECVAERGGQAWHRVPVRHTQGKLSAFLKKGK